MFGRAREYVVAQLRGAKPSFASKTPHFNFITVHYFWIVGATLTASIAIYIGGKGGLEFIDALMFASGANTQAGLNPVDVNNLNGFQQAMIYLFAMLSNPISLNTCVVFLRLYWFEKHFQDWAKEARLRRRTFSKSKSKSRHDLSQAENGMGVNGRSITVMPQNGRARLTNDGILLDEGHETDVRPAPKGDESDTTTVTEELNKSIDLDELGPLDQFDKKQNAANAAALESQKDGQGGQGHTTITFAETVRRSDGLGTEFTKFPPQRSPAEHIAILERQRNDDNQSDDVLRIPGPRDAERGLGPRRLEVNDEQEDDQPLPREVTRGSRVNDPRYQGRNNAITIAEPQQHRRDELADENPQRPGNTSNFRFRKPRGVNENQQKVHEDGESSSMHRPKRTRTMTSLRSVMSRDRPETELSPYLSYTPTVGRNSNFVGLTLEQREELGGIEYRSLRTLAIVLLVYFWGFHLLGIICFLPYILHNNRYGSILDENYIGRTWWSFWTSNMAFMDVGFSLTADSMNSFATSEWILMVMWFFIIIGNTGFPVMLRFSIWVAEKLTPKHSGLWEEFRFLLDHPRRCFTLLFPSNANWWLFWILIILNIVDLVFFIILDLGSEPVTKLPLKNRVVVGLFQAASTRTAGFSAVSMSDLHPAMPVLYMIMMYISVFPIAISIRRTNVYEEKSLGVYEDRTEDDVNPDTSAISYIGTHLRHQLSFDLWYVFLGFFLLAITEGGKISRGDFDMFAILFEIVSAYGTVGLSIGVPGVNASLCSQFTILGKLIIVAMQIRGRHRGLPYGLDRAVLLPGDKRFKKKEDEEPEAADVDDSNTAVSTGVTSGLQRQITRGRSRSRSRGRERANSNLITQLLHPGPVMHPDIAPSQPRERAVDGGHQRTRSGDIPGPLLEPIRTQSDPLADGDIAGLSSIRSNDGFQKPRRIQSAL